MKRESFIVYKSFYVLIKLLPEKERIKMYEAIFDYGFDESIPNFTNETSKAIWQSIYPQLNANNRRYENGLKGKEFGKLGGRPKNADGVIKETPNETPRKTPRVLKNKTPNITPNENDNENVNDNDILSKSACVCVESDFKAFLNKNSHIILENYVFDVSEINFKLLDKQISESEFLKTITSFDWLYENYEKICSGYYKTFTKKSKSSKFENQREYSKEELDSLVDSFDDFNV